MSPAPEFRTAELLRTLERIAAEHASTALASSLSTEDMVLTDAILRHGSGFEIFTLDTGRLHADTLAVLEAIRERYAYSVRVVRPDPIAVEAYAARFGRDAFYDQGYRSIGCAPCTRPVTPLEDMRAGRWWWEHPESRECGLHVGYDGRFAWRGRFLKQCRRERGVGKSSACAVDAPGSAGIDPRRLRRRGRAQRDFSRGTRWRWPRR